MQRIVVGIDGTEAAGAALAFAVEEAKLRKLPLRIVCAYEIPAIEYAGAAFVPTPDSAEGAEREANEVLARALTTVGPDPGIDVETAAVHGHPPTVLVQEASAATLLVVGARRHGELASLVLGSVSNPVAHHCPVPLVIVPTGSG